MKYHGKYITNQGIQISAPVYSNNKARLARDLHEMLCDNTEKGGSGCWYINDERECLVDGGSMIRGRWIKWNNELKKLLRYGD